MYTYTNNEKLKLLEVLVLTDAVCFTGVILRLSSTVTSCNYFAYGQPQFSLAEINSRPRI